MTILQQSAEAQETVLHPQMEKWMKTDRANALEVLSLFVGHVMYGVEEIQNELIGAGH